jgi:hypothetical protein
MSISYPASTTPVAGNDVPVTTVATTTSTTILVSNPNRATGGYIVNNANKNLWVSFSGAAAVAGNPATKIPANGGSMDILGGYVGAVTGIWEAGANGNCVVHEATYI